MAHLRSPTLLLDEVAMLLLDLKLFSPLKHGVYKETINTNQNVHQDTNSNNFTIS